MLSAMVRGYTSSPSLPPSLSLSLSLSLLWCSSSQVGGYKLEEELGEVGAFRRPSLLSLSLLYVPWEN
jgi:hypothetical protein